MKQPSNQPNYPTKQPNYPTIHLKNQPTYQPNQTTTQTNRLTNQALWINQRVDRLFMLMKVTSLGERKLLFLNENAEGWRLHPITSARMHFNNNKHAQRYGYRWRRIGF